MLRVLRRLFVEDDLWVHLPELVDLDVGHGHVVVHHLVAAHVLPGQHIVVRTCVVHDAFLLSFY